jgi:carbon-monoxide dehydrogenase large subunit
MAASASAATPTTRASNFVGRSVPRREDRRLLTGRGQYVADIVLPNMAHAAFLRSAHAHARIRSIDVSKAQAVPGVIYALSGIELAKLVPPVPEGQLALPKKWATRVPHKVLNPQQPLLAYDKVRHVGEAIAVIVAESRYAAEDALELVEVDLEPLAAVTSAPRGAQVDAPLVHERCGTNVIGEFSIAKGNVDAALVKAPHRLKRRFYHHRYAGIPMECRGVLAAHDARTDSLTVWSSTQVVHWVMREVATTLGIPEARVRVIAPDVGGGFGTKGHVYPEDIFIPFLARTVGRPIKWIEDRREHLQAATHSRDQWHDIEVGFDHDGRLIAVRDAILQDCGAWNPIGVGILFNSAVHLHGPYKVEHYAVDGKVVATNKVPNAPYRGAGRPESALAMERVMDLIARELKLDPAEVRKRNMIRAEEMPYATGLPYRDGEPIVYDSGDYPGALDKALAAIGGLDAFRRKQREALAAGRYIGLGLGCYVEGTGVGPFESAKVRVDPSGKLYVTSGACPQGQGMETIFAQITADQWGVTPDDVVVSLADTAALPTGFGTMASRSTVTAGSAIHHASTRLKEKVFAIGANMLECAPQDLELCDGRLRLVGVPDRSLTLQQIARAARPGWDSGRPADMEAGLETTYYYEPPTVTWAYAAHAAVVEVDVKTGRVRILDYAIAHDCGVVINPLLAEGQIIGGAVQGLGGALLEEFTYDDSGQLLTGTFMDYLLPTASDVPDIKVDHVESPSPLNALGVKGLGEGGAISPPVAIANAVCDALAPFDLELNSTPVRAEEVFRAICKASG